MVVGARRTETAASLVATYGDRVIPLRVDVSDPAQCRRFIDDAVARLGGLDVLVNNASSFFPTPVGEFGEKQWEDLIGTNLKAPAFLAQAAAPAGCRSAAKARSSQTRSTR